MAATWANDKRTVAEARDLAKEARLFGLPFVIFEKQFDFITYVNKPEPFKLAMGFYGSREQVTYGSWVPLAGVKQSKSIGGRERRR